MSDGSRRDPVERVIAARPTIYKGIKMRSRLEAGFAMWLDQRRWTWTYEPCAFGNQDQQYLPDFRIENVRDLVTGRTAPAYLDVKPHYDFDLGGLLRRMEVIWDSESEAHLIVQAPAKAGLGVGRLACSYRVETAQADGRSTDWRFDGWAAWLAETPAFPGPLLGVPLWREQGPWHGEWWKAGADMAPVE